MASSFPLADLSNLSAHETECLQQMRDLFKDTENPDGEDSWFQLKDHTFLRYLKARGFQVKKAKSMLEDTLAFRAKYHPDQLAEETPELSKLFGERFNYVAGHAKRCVHLR
jgi:hypothetical protein